MWWRTAGLALVLVLTGALRGQEVTGLTMSRLQQTAQQAVERQQWAEAAPALAELDRRLRESSAPGVAQAREELLHLLGHARLQLGEFEAAAAAFAEYVERYPRGRAVAAVRLGWGDAAYYQSNFAAAREAYDGLRQAPGVLAQLDAAQQLGFWDRLSDCLFALQAWDGASGVFSQLQETAARQLDPAVAEEKQTKAASYRLQAAVAQGELEQALAVLPALVGRRGPARADLAFNLALLRGGDAWYERSRYGEALYFYHQVLPPAELAAHGARETERLERAWEAVKDVPRLAARRLELENALAVARHRREQVERALAGDVPDYQPSLLFRIARCYLARERHWEAYWAFVRLEQHGLRSGRDDYAEEAWYGQVQAAKACLRPDRARLAGEAYLEQPTAERFLVEIAEVLIELARAEEEPERVRAIAVELVARLRAQPELSSAAKVVFLVGSTLIAQADTAGVQELLAPLLADQPRARWADGLQYWLALAALMSGDYAEALAGFEGVAGEYPKGAYTEDARFRIGVCRFGMLQYEQAEAVLQRFVDEHPESRLQSEARALLGDLAAAAGRVNEALAAYRAAEEAGAQLTPPLLGYINHAAFQGGRLLLTNRRAEEAVAWFERYIERWGTQGQLTEALFEQGRALAALGRSTEQLERWLAAIERHGDQVEERGIDLMLHEYPTRYDQTHGALPIATLRAALERAQTRGATTLAWRLVYALRELHEEDTSWPHLTRSDWGEASAAVLVQAARDGRAREPGEAHALAEAALERAGDTLFAETALHLLGELKQAQGDLGGALRAYRQAAARFPGSVRAATARLREGDLLRASGERTAALLAYRSVLQTREWRGAAWAEANYKIGLTHFEAGEWKEAFAFCQRVYVLYAALAEWAAPAYLTSAQALEALGRPDEARATYGELLSREELRDTRWGLEAAQRVAALP